MRKHADAIAEKYIFPDEHTFDYALMFVPSESVYYELLLTEDSKYGMLDEYCRSKRVFPVSPNTFYACLSAFAISLQGQKIEERTRHILAGMAGLKKQFEGFTDVYDNSGLISATRNKVTMRRAKAVEPRAAIRWNSWLRVRCPKLKRRRKSSAPRTKIRA